VSGFGAKAYSKLGLETDILNADPHRLVMVLFDGALQSISRAKGFLAQRRIPQKCEALSLACEIVDSGLRVSVDPSVDPEFARRLVSLYQYIVMRLLQANLRNDVAAMDEAARLLSGLRDAWAKIGPAAAAMHGGADASAAPVATVAHVPGPGARALQAYRA